MKIPESGGESSSSCRFHIVIAIAELAEIIVGNQKIFNFKTSIWWRSVNNGN